MLHRRRRVVIPINNPFTFAAVTDRVFGVSLLTILGVVLLGGTLDVMEVDAAQYAGMSRDMLQRGDALRLFYRGQDHLDKPPLLFWLSALSFQLFGVCNFSYRLPSILFAFLGLYSTYRFTALYHGTATARLATILFGCSSAFFLMCNDVRCDTLLTGSVITAIWLGCTWLERGGIGWLIGAALAVSAGMLAKGPIGLVAPVLAIGGQVIATRKWRRLRDPQLLVALLVIGLALLPMCIGLYQQHGLHGLRFYFWEQSFGRVTGENRWKDDSTAFFFTHELLWQMLPWTLFVLAGLWTSILSIWKRNVLAEYASISGALLVFGAISLSQFKLPHYLFVITPLFAVLGATGIHAYVPRTLLRLHYLVVAVLALLVGFLTFIVFPTHRWPFLALLILASGLAGVALWREGARKAMVQVSVIFMAAVGLVMNGYFYPNLLAYQANARAGQWAADRGLGPDQFFGMQISGTALDFYTGHPVRWISNAGEARSVIRPGVVIYTDSAHRAELIVNGLVPKGETTLKNYPAQRLALPFLDPAERASVVTDRYLLSY